MNKIVALILLILFPFSTVASAAEQVFFYHTDPVGTPLAMTNASGQVVWRADYKPFGEENTVTANPKNNKEFVGKEKDEETGLYYFGARYLDSKVGRFVAVDPVRAVDPRNSKTNEEILLNSQGLNPYTYAFNNPYKYVDNDGKYGVLVALGIILFGEMVIPRTMGQRDSFLDKHAADLVMLPIGIEKEGLQVGSSLSKVATFDFAELSGMLRAAAKGKGNFGIGTATREQAEAMGKAWVGKGHEIASDGKTLVSADGLRVYRPPSYKPKLGRIQANFENKVSGIKQSISNAHLDVKD